MKTKKPSDAPYLRRIKANGKRLQADLQTLQLDLDALALLVDAGYYRRNPPSGPVPSKTQMIFTIGRIRELQQCLRAVLSQFS